MALEMRKPTSEGRKMIQELEYGTGSEADSLASNLAERIFFDRRDSSSLENRANGHATERYLLSGVFPYAPETDSGK
jgi:hypothetical protein